MAPQVGVHYATLYDWGRGNAPTEQAKVERFAEALGLTESDRLELLIAGGLASPPRDEAAELQQRLGAGLAELASEFGVPNLVVRGFGGLGELTPEGVVIYVGNYPNGRPRYKWSTAYGTRKEAQRELTRRIHELQTGSHVEPARMTVGQLLERWLQDHARVNCTAKTAERYEEIVRLHLEPALGHHPLAKLQPLHIQAYYTLALRSGRRDGRGGLAAQTVLHHHRLLRTALQAAVRWQLLPRNPADAVEAPRPAEREMGVLNAEGTVQLLETAEGTRLYVPVLIGVLTGMRLGEILGLQWEDVDLDAGLLRVRRSMQQLREEIVFKAPKTRGSRRAVSLPPLLVQALRVHKGEQAGRRLAMGPLYQDQGLVVCRETGEPWPPKAVSQAFQHLAARAGCPEIRFHDLRHSHASQLLEQRVPLKAVSERLGHARASTTQDIYAHVLPGMHEEAARVAGDLIQGALDRRRKRSQTAS